MDEGGVLAAVRLRMQESAMFFGDVEAGADGQEEETSEKISDGWSAEEIVEELVETLEGEISAQLHPKLIGQKIHVYYDVPDDAVTIKGSTAHLRVRWSLEPSEGVP
jgi:hypothetical protein